MTSVFSRYVLRRGLALHLHGLWDSLVCANARGNIGSTVRSSSCDGSQRGMHPSVLACLRHGNLFVFNSKPAAPDAKFQTQPEAPSRSSCLICADGSQVASARHRQVAASANPGARVKLPAQSADSTSPVIMVRRKRPQKHEKILQTRIARAPFLSDLPTKT